MRIWVKRVNVYSILWYMFKNVYYDIWDNDDCIVDDVDGMQIAEIDQV